MLSKKQGAMIRVSACLLQQQQQCHSFSTGLVKEKHPSLTITTNEATLQCAAAEVSVLGSAAQEAQRLSELAAQCRSKKQKDNNSNVVSKAVAAEVRKPTLTADEKTIEGALEGAQKLLFVTTRSSPLQDAIQNKQGADPKIKRQISCLHRAFLAVTSWCLNVVDTTGNGDPRVLEKALEVARRAHQLQLPFILPLHQRLMAAIATHYDPQVHYRRSGAPPRNKLRTPGGLILEIAERASCSLGPQAISSSHFFRDALVALAKRRRYNDIVVILRGMESQFRIVELELDTLAHLLAVLKDTVEEEERQDSAELPSLSDNADFLEILNLLNPYVWKTMSNYRTLSHILTKNKTQHIRDEMHRKGKSLGLEDTMIEGLLPPRDHDSVLPTSPSHLANSSTERRKRTTTTTNNDELDDMASWVYCRERYSLPDIGIQIEKLYQDQEYRYGNELELLILTRMADEEVDDDDDDDSNESRGDRMEDDFPIEDDDLDIFPWEDEYFDEFSSDDDDDTNGRV
jgi:hypothetical protein